MSDTQQVLIHLRPIGGAPWLSHDPAFGTSTVSIAAEVSKHPGPLTITDVCLSSNGRLVHRVVDPVTVIVSPRIPEQGDYLTIYCTAPYSPVAALQRPSGYTPSPNESYGLQRPAMAGAKAP